jgi:hypothetical protein
MWKLNLKDKCIHKYIHGVIDIYMHTCICLCIYTENMTVLVGLFKGTMKRQKKEREC